MLFDHLSSPNPAHPRRLLERIAVGTDERDRKARAAIELWLEEYPAAHRAEMLSRLLADDRDFLSAFFELYLHALFAALDYEPHLHPTVSHEHERVPDFLMIRRGQPRFYLEATVVHEEASVIAERRQREIVLSALREVESNSFDLLVHKAQLKEHAFERKSTIRGIEEWLATLDPLQAELNASPRRPGHRETFTYKWLHLDVSAIARPYLARGIRASVTVRWDYREARKVGCPETLRSSLSGKARRYGNLMLPYVLAVNAMSEACTFDEIQDAAFGTMQYMVGENEAGWTSLGAQRATDGPLSDPERSGSLRVSALLAESQLTPLSMLDEERITPVLILNPRARYSFLDDSPFLQVKDGRGDGGVAGAQFVPARRILRLDKRLTLP